MLNKIIITLIITLGYSQEAVTEYLVQGQDTIDVFSYQIPQGYSEQEEHPLLIVFHQWGGNENSTYYTTFDEEADSRNWIFMSPHGGSSNNYNHQGSQDMVRSEILWLIEHFNIDQNRIYMVGGSMGGAAGMVYANNHLNPLQPMVAATASGSGILDCERRAIEMDGNNSMTEWFGGNWNEVPFEYHRNSAIYFADSTQSMHYNLQYTPIYLDFGASEPHRTHAEEMYDILLGYNQNMWIDQDPTGSHGFSVMDELHTCDWLSQFTLESSPSSVTVNLDEPERAYFFDAKNKIDSTEFIFIDGHKTASQLVVNNFTNSDSLVAYILEASLEDYHLEINTSINKFGISGDHLIDGTAQIESVDAATSSGIPLQYTIEDDIVWFEHYGLPPYELPMYGEFILNIEISTLLDGDVNQDGSCNVQDIIIMINHIIGTLPLNEEQHYLADMNSDGGVDVMDIIMVINIIIER
jgi:pimeloyl-ACP methyl ester carboxylesterase